MIGWIFLAGGVSGTGACAYFVLRGRGVHRLVIPRFQLRADISRLDREADRLACAAIRLTGEASAACHQRDEARAALEKAGLRIADLEEQLAAFDALCAENTELRSTVANAHAIRPLPVADDASALPDHLQEFADDTATAWRASA